MPSASIANPLDLAQLARGLTQHLARPRPLRYWFDFLLTHTSGCVAFYLAAARPTPVFVRIVAFVACVLLWYRSLAFIHELVHLRSGQLSGFRTIWNLLAGIPLLFPSFLYLTHLEHHAGSVYGTVEDGEYLAFAARPRLHLVLFPLVSSLAPLLAVLRFGILVPAAWVVPGIRGWVQQRASALVIHGAHCRREPNRQELRLWRMQESCCFAWLGSVFIVCISGRLSWRWVWIALGALSLISCINSIRTLLAHRFRNVTGRMSLIAQIEDSVNHPHGGFFTELVCPVGLRFHALHHLLPSLPYHSLPEAHRILMHALPQDSVYRQTNSPSLWATARTLWSGVAC